MPKGDRERFKADPEDGTTPIANLLLEAVACARLSGMEKGAILFLWRQTYGWMVEGKRLKEKEVSQFTLTKYLGINSKTAFNILKSLTDKNIFLRDFIGAGKGYVYKMNTDIKSWNSGSIDLDILRLYTVGDKAYGDTTSGLKTVGVKTKGTNDISKDNPDSQNTTGLVSQDNAHPPSQVSPQAYLYNKEILNKDINKKADILLKKINEIRGYKPLNKEPAEIKSLIKMLKHYSEEQVIECYESMKAENFWEHKELFMMSVESQIGAKTHKAKPKEEKYGHMVQK